MSAPFCAQCFAASIPIPLPWSSSDLPPPLQTPSLSLEYSTDCFSGDISSFPYPAAGSRVQRPNNLQCGVAGTLADTAIFRNHNLWVSKISASYWNWISPDEAFPGLTDSKPESPSKLPFESEFGSGLPAARNDEKSKDYKERGGFKARTQFRHRMMDVGCLVTRLVVFGNMHTYLLCRLKSLLLDSNRHLDVLAY